MRRRDAAVKADAGAATQPPIVVEPLAGSMVAVDGAPWIDDCRSRVRAQIARTGLADAGWRVDVVPGEPARRIAAAVRAADARLLLLGRERRGTGRTSRSCRRRARACAASSATPKDGRSRR